MRLPIFLVLSLALAAPLAAQEPGPGTVPAARARADLPSVLSRVPIGALVRVETHAGEQVEGPLVAWSGSTLAVGEPGRERFLAPAEVRALRVRQRETRRGATIGGAIGGGAAFLYTGFMAALFHATGYGTAGEAVALTAGGTLLGAAGGAGVGAVIGGAATRWREVYRAEGTLAAAPTPAPTPVVAPPAAPLPEGRTVRRRLGSAELTAGYGRTELDGGTSGGFMGRVALLSEWDRGEGEVRRFAGVGLEIGFQELGTTPVREAQVHRPECMGNCTSPLDTVPARRRYRVRDVGAVTRLGMETRGVQPYVLAGLGMHIRQHAQFGPSESGGGYGGYRTLGLDLSGYHSIGGSLGGGVQLRSPRRPFSLGVEARLHSNFFPREDDRFGVRDGFGFWTVGATLNRRW